VTVATDNLPVSRGRVFLHAVVFVLGFSLIFVIGWGGTATLLGQLFGTYKTLLAQIGGLVVILFGLHTLGWIRLPFLDYELRPSGAEALTQGRLAEETVYQAMVLSAAYAAGLGIPFLLLGLSVERASKWMHRFRKHTRTVQIISGLLLIGIGLMLLTNRLFLIAVWAQQQGWYLDVPSSGLLSFLSPCVFPLVPAYLSFLGAQVMR